MTIKTDAMIAHGGAEGYTLHIEYDPETFETVLKAVYNDGTEKLSDFILGNEDLVADEIIGRKIVNLVTHAPNIGAYSLRGCGRLVSISAPDATSVRSFALYGCNVLSETYFPRVTTIQGSGFANCSALESVSFPSLVSIEGKPFENCSNLSEIYVGPNVTSLSNTAFSGAADGVVINCGFSSGAVAGAPWGATNATINYDVPAPNPPAGLSIAPNPGLIQNIDFEPIEDIQPVEPEPVEVKKTTRKAAK